MPTKKQPTAMPKPAPKRKRRPDPIGQAIRYARSEKALKVSGGLRTQFRLSPEAVSALNKIMSDQGFDKKVDALEWALLVAA